MTMEDPPPQPPVSGFLTPEDLRALRHQLRGVRVVEVRQIGGAPTAGVEVVSYLQAEGYEVHFRELGQMTPPPLRRIVFRYLHGHAEMTIAPEVRG